MQHILLFEGLLSIARLCRRVEMDRPIRPIQWKKNKTVAQTVYM